MARVVCITLNPALDLAFNLDALTLGARQPPHRRAAGSRR